MKKSYQIFFAAVVVTYAMTIYAHPGRTDSSGGHTDRKTGTYHYHNSGGSTSTTTYEPTPAYDEPAATPKTAPSKSTTTAKPSYQTTPTNVKPSVKPKAVPSKPTIKQNESVKITENHWKEALNKKVFKGKLDANISMVRVDILTYTQAIEVEKLSNYQAGIEQTLKSAQVTQKKPVLALYIDGEKDGYELIQRAENLCNKEGITFLLVNSHVSVDDLIDLISKAGMWGHTVESKSLPEKTNNDSQSISNTTGNGEQLPVK